MSTEETNPLAIRADKDNARRAARRIPMTVMTIAVWAAAIWAMTSDVLSENHAVFVLVAAIFWTPAFLVDLFIDDSPWDK